MAELEQVVERLIREETLVTIVKVDLLNGLVMEGEAVVDTGSVLSFLGADEIRAHAPELLKKLCPYPARITGISGEEVEILGSLLLPCIVAGRLQTHKFVVADVVEPFLIGLDFMRSHRATWDWLTQNIT